MSSYKKFLQNYIAVSKKTILLNSSAELKTSRKI